MLSIGTLKETECGMEGNELNIKEILDQFDGIDRDTLPEKLPRDCVHLYKEIFKFNELVIKATNYRKNGGRDDYVFENEAKWLTYLQKYPFVPKFYGKYYANNNIYLIIEYVEGISLDRVDRRFLKEFDPYFELLVNKLYHMLDVFNRENITHKDLRPNNIIINKTMSIFKIIDFQYCSPIFQDLETKNEQQAEHYRKSILNVGGMWRMPGMERHDFTTDRYAVEKILKDLKTSRMNVFQKLFLR